MAQPFPPHYMITGKFSDQTDFQSKLTQALEAGPRLVQLRCKGMNDDDYQQLARLAAGICASFKATLLLATSPELLAKTGADGLHLSSDRLSGLSERPVAADKLLSVSCHTRADLELANRLGADILLLSPVKPTSSHPELPGLGWECFREMTANYPQPAYGLGGMKPTDVKEAQAAGAAGIAATSGLWS